MGWQGIDIYPVGDRIVFRVLELDGSKAPVASGTDALRLYEVQANATLKSYDFNDNTFKTTALTTETLALTHRAGNNGTFDTGIWTAVLTTVTGFTPGNIYLAHTTHSTNGTQTREFQFGGGPTEDIVRLIEANRGHHAAQGRIFYADQQNGDTHANGARGGLTDPYSSIQDWHDNALVSWRGDLLILLAGDPAAETTHSEAVTLTKHRFSIRSVGRHLLWTRSGNGDTITLSGIGIEVSGFQLNTAGTGNGAGLVANNTKHLRVEDVFVRNTRGSGIIINNSNETQIFNVRFTDTGQVGNSHALEFNAGNGETCDTARIRDCKFDGVIGDSIRLNPTGGGTIIDAIIENNVINNSSGRGIFIGSSDVSRTIVTRNLLANNAGGNIVDNGTNTVYENNEQWATEVNLNLVKSVTNKLDTMFEPDGLNFRYTEDSLVNSPASEGAIVISALSTTMTLLDNTGRLFVRRDSDNVFQLTGLGNLVGRTKLYFGIKKYTSDIDDDAIYLLEETDGTLVIEKEPQSGDPGGGTITVDDENNGDITISIDRSISAQFKPREELFYMIKKDNSELLDSRSRNVRCDILDSVVRSGI
jgi:hypothetical protein